MLRRVHNRKRKNQKDSETKLHVIASRKIVWSFSPKIFAFACSETSLRSGWWESRIG